MINVTCAVIRNEEYDVLVVQRGAETDHPFKWEFPGGKLDKDETEEECVIREVGEELSIEIIICAKLPEVEYDYGHKQIKLIPFVCDTLDELPLLSEHLAFKWVEVKDLLSIDFSEADIIVARSYYERFNVRDDSNIELNHKYEKSFSDDVGLQEMINSIMSTKEAEWIASSAIDNKAIFYKLISYSYSSDKKLAFHASWTLSKACEKDPESIYPFLHDIIDKLNTLENESAQRSLLRIISMSDINRISSNDHGILADHCFTALRSGYSAIAIKAYSMEILFNLSQKYPELRNELSASINMLQGEGSAGILARGRTIMKKLAETPIKPESA